MRVTGKMVKIATKVQSLCMLALLILAAVSNDPQWFQVIGALLLLIPFLGAQVIINIYEDDICE